MHAPRALYCGREAYAPITLEAPRRARGRARQTQKFPCIFCSAPPPTPPPKGEKEGKEIFGLRRRKETPQRTTKAFANEVLCSVSLQRPEAQYTAVCAERSRI